MSDVEKLIIEVTPEVAAEIRAAVEDGEYGGVGEVVCAALRDWTHRRNAEPLETEELRRLIREGMESGPGIDADTAFSEVRAGLGGNPTE